MSMLNGLWLDVRHAWRSLGRNPWFLLGALLTLVLGIGANVAVFSIVNALVLRPLPFGDHSARLLTLHPTLRQQAEEPGWGDAEISYPDFLDFSRARSFEAAGAYLTRSFVLAGEGSTAERVPGGSITPGLLSVLGVEPVLGRRFTDEDAAAPGLEGVVMLTDGLWRRRYGADPGIVGRSVVINDRARTVIGVLPPGFRFPERDDLYMPMRLDEAQRSARVVNAVALLRRGVDRRQAQAELDSIAARLAREYPDSNRDVGVVAVPIRATYVGADERTMAAVLMASVGFVLLIVCANLANLMLVRGAARHREMAVRAAMGAGTLRLARTAVAESLLLAVPGALVGLLVSQWALDGMRGWIPEDLPFWVRLDLDRRVALFTAAICVFVGLAVGLIPAWRAARPRPSSELTGSVRAASLGRAGLRLQATLAAAQIALCLALLVGANLMVRSFLAQQQADLGFDDRPLLTARIYLAGDAYDEPRARAGFFAETIRRLIALPGVEAAAVSSGLPGDDGGAAATAVVDGRTARGDEVAIQTVSITPEYFRALNLSLLAGRPFTASEAVDPEADVVILNGTLAETLWPGQSPLDRRIGLRGAQGDTWFRVIGVAPDVHYEEIGASTEASRRSLYLPYARSASRSMAVILRSAGEPASLVTLVRGAIASAGGGIPLYRLMPLRDLRRLTTWEQQFMGGLMSIFAVGALLLACLGVYALVAYSVGRRAMEIGVRLALGARPQDVLRMLAIDSGRVALAGTLAGLALSIGVGRLLGSRLYGVHLDPTMFLMAAAPMLVAVGVATWGPARRAAQSDPTEALREP